MEQDFISKDIFEKTLYAFAYLDNGKISYMINTQKDYIYEKAYSLEQEQVFVTPIFHKTFWYNYEYRLADVKKDFKKMVSNELTEDYLEKVRKIKGEKTSNLTIGALTKYGTNCVDTLSRYYFRWGIVSNNVENIEV